MTTGRRGTADVDPRQRRRCRSTVPRSTDTGKYNN